MKHIWTRDDRTGIRSTTVVREGTEWAVHIVPRADYAYDVTCDWGDTYDGAPTYLDAVHIAEQFIRNSS